MYKYMDDLKVYASTKQHLNHLIKIIAMLSNDINMKFGLDKCKTIMIHSKWLRMKFIST